MTSKEFGKLLQDKLTSEYGVELSVASNQQIYRSLALICRQMMSENHKKFQSKAIGTGTKQVYYLCMEFLMGRSLKTSLLNLGLDEVAKKALSDADINIDSIFEEEPEGAADTVVAVNMELARSYQQAMRDISEQLGVKNDISAGVLTRPASLPTRRKAGALVPWRRCTPRPVRWWCGRIPTSSPLRTCMAGR